MLADESRTEQGNPNFSPPYTPDKLKFWVMSQVEAAEAGVPAPTFTKDQVRGESARAHSSYSGRTYSLFEILLLCQGWLYQFWQHEI